MTGTMHANPYNDVTKTAVDKTKTPDPACSETIAPPEPAPAVTEGKGEGVLAKELEEAKGEISKLKDDYLRALAEAENVRRRAVRDREDASRFAISAFAGDLLSVADNLRRALDSVEPEARQKDTVLDGFINGVEMTERELAAVFQRHGIRPVEAAGQLFDPHVHEAMFEIPDAEVPSGTVVTVLQTGYTIHDRILRPARVGIAKGGPKGRLGDDSDVAAAAPEDANARPTAAHASSEAYEKRTDTATSGAGARLNESL
jgi:molecular chaperone GrpE